MTAPSDINTHVVQQLVLARLLVPVKRPLSRAKVEAAVVKAIAQPLPESAAQAAATSAFAACEQAGYVTTPTSGKAAPQLTAAGRKTIESALGPEALPTKKAWEHAQLLLALNNIGHRYKPTKQGLSADMIAAVILSKRRGVRAPQLTSAAVVDRLAWRALGVERDAPFSITAVQRYLLRDIVPEDVRASPAIWRRMLAMRTVAAEKHDAIALSRALLCQPAGRTQEAAHNDNAGANAAPGFQLADFARAVQAAAERPEVTRFHADRAFIGSVWEHMRGHNPVGTMSLEEFKKKLVEAHRERLLHISRADLIGAMDPREVERSEARYQDATFHFVVLAAGGTR